MSNKSIIELSRISKIFRTEQVESHVLTDVDITIDKGEFVLIAGPSGCGKSTLLSILGLLDTPTSGAYRLAGHDVSKLSEGQRADTRNREMGFVFQSFNLIGNLSVVENVELPLIYRGMSKKESRARAESVLNRLSIFERRRHYPKQLSGGQQQRVAVARALAGDPQIILADEPTGNLDSKNGEIVIGLLEQLAEEGTTICMVSHEEDHARIASRVVHLKDGLVNEAELAKI
ncbi:ABC transporter ATP-binding protein [Puniceicoccaceae bacterium K14]|nr:ABC transporter ATP-binding protein [Puniceicoccaceae bacterium K14]